MSSYKNISVASENAVVTITLNRPQALNALNQELLAELANALEGIQKMSFAEAKVLILTGSGEKSFVAGGDIKEINALNSEQALQFAKNGQALFRRLETLKIPVIAAVNGFALGGGLELALACDFIYAAENAKFGLPEVTLGLIPGFGGTVRLARVVGMARAKEMTYSGEMLSASQALDCGLVNKVCVASELLPTVQKLAAVIASRGPLAVAAAKRSVMGAWDFDIDQAMQWEAANFSGLFSSLDVKEGTLAFIEKRKAAFKGQ